MLDALAAQLTVYAPDILGYGFTDFKAPGDEAAPEAVNFARRPVLVSRAGRGG